MRKKLLLTIALGAALAIVAAGTAISGTVSVGQIQVNVPGVGGTTTTQLLPQCADLTDNDGDGLVALADPDCSGPLDTSESGTSGSGSSGGSGGSSSGGGVSGVINGVTGGGSSGGSSSGSGS